MDGDGDELPDLRAWAAIQAHAGRAAEAVAAELAERWGVGSVALRMLTQQTYGVGLQAANEVCGAVRTFVDHPLSAISHRQLMYSWMRDMSQPGTAVTLSKRSRSAWTFSMSSRSSTLGDATLGPEIDNARDARDQLERLVGLWSEGRVVVHWNRIDESGNAHGTLVESSPQTADPRRAAARTRPSLAFRTRGRRHGRT